MTPFPNGLIIVSKHDCPTCTLIEPVYHELEASDIPLTIYTQDDPAFPPGIDRVIEDTGLENSFRLNIETVPTLIRFDDGREVGRLVGWHKEEWQAFTGIRTLGADLPDFRPGCGSLSVEPGIAEKLTLLFGNTAMTARKIEVAAMEDEIEACFERGWTDGLPVVPPTEIRVLRMLQGTHRAPDEIVGTMPPDGVPCTVEKIAINAVMAGCKPEYMPVILSTVEAALIEEFCMHGLLCTTYFSGPVVIVSGPAAKAIGMNSGMNALGQGNRANATIGRALQLIIRNVGGGRPGEIDRATMGNPGKYTYCFAENLEASSWESLSESRGFKKGTSTVTLFAGEGLQGMMDQQSRNPESLASTFAHSLRTVAHYKIPQMGALLLVSPEHSRVFENAGWSKARLKEELNRMLEIPLHEMLRGVDGNAEGIPSLNPHGVFQEKKGSTAGNPEEGIQTVPKFRQGDGLEIVRVGGNAGMFSAIIGAWVASGPVGSIPVSKEIKL
ncbi:MAG: thioredoxin family protein [SAR324 cluster bacterium]|nr:thioredoxin family protein [SAR324 cluster bacterium]